MSVKKEPRGERKISHRVGLSALEEVRLRRRLRRAAPSAPWVDAQFKTFSDTSVQGESITYRFHDPNVFPPGGAETKMVRCDRCGVLMPPQMIENGICLDHGDHAGWGPSPSAVAIRGLQRLNLRLSDSTLPPESTAALRDEIRDFQKRTQRALVARR